MPSYELVTDGERRMVVCRIRGFVTDAEAVALGNEIVAATGAARSRWGTLRMLFDNRAGTVFSSSAMQALAGTLRFNRRPGDRTAILVATSLSKVQSKRAMTDGDQVFISEQAALTWLGAWADGAVPRDDQRATSISSASASSVRPSSPLASISR